MGPQQGVMTLQAVGAVDCGRQTAWRPGPQACDLGEAEARKQHHSVALPLRWELGLCHPLSAVPP